MDLRIPQPEVIPEPEPLRFCRDCKHRKPERSIPHESRYDGCYAPENAEPNLVSGESERKWQYCATLRVGRGDDCCGPQGRWFQPIKDLTEK